MTSTKIYQLSHNNAIVAFGHDTLLNAMEIMSKYYIRHLPVLDDQYKTKRILTDSDIIQYLNNHPVNEAFKATLSSLPSQQVITTNEKQTVSQAILDMLHHDVSSLPIMKQNQIHGIITVRDILYVDDIWKTIDDMEINPYADNLGQPISNPIQVSWEHSFWQILNQLSNSLTRHLLVFDQKSKTYTGIIPTLLVLSEISDYLRNIVKQIEFESLENFLFTTTVEQLMVPRPTMLIPPTTISTIRTTMIEENLTAIIIGLKNKTMRIITERDLFSLLAKSLR